MSEERKKGDVRVWMIAKECDVPSKEVLHLLRHVGHSPKSVSSKINLLPIEREAMVATIRSRWPDSVEVHAARRRPPIRHLGQK